ncbi:MAG: deoxyribodipyrimidine photo-lyase, partial [Bacteroidales bacterium]
MKIQVNIFWFRRDLRLEDNAGLYHALSSINPVVPLFIFDTDILNGLERDDPRVTFIYENLEAIDQELKK